MAVRLAQALATTLADAVDTYLGNAGTIKIYTGTQPATADSSIGGSTLLATFNLGSPGFGSAVNGVITLSGTPLTVAASNTGTAGWFRMWKADGTTAVLDGSVGTSGAQINLNTTSITSGVNVSITSGTITMPTS
jgi:hypothetical protein